jgi:hypothetical protein
MAIEATGGAEAIVRACGHECPFVPKGDRHDEARREKFRTKPCRDCGVAKHLADLAAAKAAKAARKAAAAKAKTVPKWNRLPAGTRIELVRLGDGRWSGVVTGGGAMGVVKKLAGRWLRQAGAVIGGEATR